MQSGHCKVIEDKRSDPAVVVVDEQGNLAMFAFRHLGGANELASKVAHVLILTAITTASDIQGFESIDLCQKIGAIY